MNTEQPNQDWILLRLKHSLQGLAAPSDVQLGLFPDFVAKVDELALEFDNFSFVALTNYKTEFSLAQANSLESIRSHFATAEESDFDEPALIEGDFWRTTRSLAVHALESFSWAVETPPSYGHEYVRSDRMKKPT